MQLDLKKRRTFLRGFASNPREVSSITPSSAFLERRVVCRAALSSATRVVELGPGTGGTTRAILSALPSQAKLLAIESSYSFSEYLKSSNSDPRLTVVLGNAADLGKVSIEQKVNTFDAIVSGIPFSTMPTGLAHKVVEEIYLALAPGGRFVAYQLRNDVARYATPLFGEPTIEWEWRNLPPLRVFTWQKSFAPDTACAAK